jgi:hypothetical protein
MSNTTKMNISEFESKVMEELAAIRAMLANKPVAAPAKEKQPRKPRDPNAAPNPWIVFTGRVRDALKGAGKPAGKECQQFASYLKADFPDAYQMDDAEILAAHADWTPPPPKPKESKSESEPNAKPKDKPKRTLSDEQKAKMAAGRKAAAEARKAAASKVNEAPVEEDGSEEAPVEDVPAPVASKPFPSTRPLPFKGKKYHWDPEGNGMWHAEKDGSRGAWAGKLSSDKKSLDASASDYTA